MNIEEKLSGFAKIAMREAEKKRTNILTEVSLEYKKACDETTLILQKKAELIIKEEEYKMDQHNNKEILNATTEAKRSLIELRKQLKEELFNNVIDMLADYIETNEYEDFLITEIKGLALKFGGKIVVYLCRRDMIFAEKLLEVPSVTIVEDKDDLIGGYKAVLKEKNIIIDNTYKARLKAAKEAFVGFRII